MKLIPLTQGKFTKVDDDDFEKLKKYKWHYHKKGYAERKSNNKHIKMHRQILGLTHGDKKQGDHRDRQKLNNQKNNLRICTNLENSANRNSRKNSTSEYLGVCFCKKENKWKAQICKNYKIIRIGAFKTEIEAALAYNKKAIEIHGEFANLNFK